ncbi:MAG: RNA 2',3'-cyclic phosphodiesterase [Acidobacteria bacterium]|nr:RNA 2',3'-cyclic phosphodiesterase [Acidobacteriota bacterium]
MRLFVALELSEAVRAALAELVGRLQRTSADIRWARPEGMHLTLKFIGEVAAEKLPRLREALGQVPRPGPVELDFSGLGYFPSERRPRVLWVGVRASSNLAELAVQVETTLEPLGIPCEKRAYVPHLTLGRFRSASRLARLQEEIARLPATEFGRFQAKEFILFESRLSPRGAEYSKLEHFPLVRP